MRLLLEVSHLKNATPATVSRGGVLFVNDLDVGWRPYMDSWLSKFKEIKDEFATSVFTLAIAQYLPDSFMEDMHAKETICPMADMGYIKTLTCIIDSLYHDLQTKKDQIEVIKNLKEQNNDDKIKEIYEAFFIFAVMWSFGGPLTDDKISFNNYIKSASKVKFPE